MDKIKTSEQAAKEIEQLRAKIEKLRKEGNLLQQVLQKLKGLVIQHHLGIAVIMYHNGSLAILLSYMNELYQKDKNKESLQVLYMVFDLGIECIFGYDPQYRKIFKAFNTKLTDMRKYTTFLHENKRKQYEKYKDLCKRLMEIKHAKDIETYERGIKLNDYVNQILLQQAQIYDCYSQIIVSWLRIQATKLQASIFKQKGYMPAALCCALHFEQTQQLISLDFPNHFYVNFNPSQPKLYQQSNKQNQVKYVVTEAESIKKMLVYYLNNEGGHLFIGIKELQAKNGRAFGFSMSSQERQTYLHAFELEIITKIFPTDNENEEEDQNQENERLKDFVKAKQIAFQEDIKKNKYSHQLSESMYLDFIPLYNPKNLLFSRNNNGNMLFVIRLRAKVGNPAQVYHYLNQKDLPQAFMQQNKSLTMIEYYDLVYLKLKNEANGIAVPKQPKCHPLCRYSLKYERKEQQKKKLQQDEKQEEFRYYGGKL